MKRNPAAADSLSIWPMPNRDHIQGPIDAPMTLLEYGDYECPYCGEAYPVVKEIQKRMGNLVCFAFRNFPLVNAHPHAQHAAEAAEAAAVQGRFWEMHDLLYENQRALEDDDIAGYASAMHLDASRLLREILAGTHAPRVREDFRSGARHDVNQTPTFFVNGVRYDGEIDVEELLAALTGKAALGTR
jgi:protein-disulfide isomerase